ncbi:MAG: DsbA family oxidoreductase [Jiangellaceae bacterium]
MSLIVYGDFTCPACYLAAQRSRTLSAAGVDVQWRAVDHAPSISVRPEAVDGPGVQSAIDGLEESLLDGEYLPTAPQPMRPRSPAAIAGYAEAVGAGVPMDVLDLLFSAYWDHGLDIGDPEVLRPLLVGPMLRGGSPADPLRESGYAVSGNRGPVTTDAYLRIRAWDRAWQQLGSPPPPVVVDRGELSHGRRALDVLATHIIASGARADVDHDDPGRYPDFTLRPSATWLSQVGGPWARAWMS